jgi:CubicO group peptidase (beta-lactamase class C family)
MWSGLGLPPEDISIDYGDGGGCILAVRSNSFRRGWERMPRTELLVKIMKTSISIVLSCSLAALAAGPFAIDKTDPGAAGMNPARLAWIPARMKEFVAAGKTAGVVTLVARHGHVASLEAVGYQDLENKTPMHADTIFRLASVTKPVTCAGIMILVDQGRLSLINAAEKYLP